MNRTFLKYHQIKEAKYRLADNAFDKEKSIYYYEVLVGDESSLIISAEIREVHSSEWISTLYVYMRPDSNREKPLLEQRVPMTSKTFDNEEDAKKYLLDQKNKISIK